MAVSAREPVPMPEPQSGRGRHARGRSPREDRSGFGRWLGETAIIVVAALVLSALVRMFFVQAFYVPSSSMEDTLLISDRILASKINKTIAGINRGDVVVFKDPGGWLDDPLPPPGGVRGAIRSALTFVGLLPADSGQELVKRVIAVAGDRIACCDAQGHMILNGVALKEDYIKTDTAQVRFDVVVPPGRVFVMGDNRANSRDSRYHLEIANGGVPVDNVVGRVIVVIWPLGRIATVPVPDIFENPAITKS